jgi:hypothetical protein
MTEERSFFNDVFSEAQFNFKIIIFLSEKAIEKIGTGNNADVMRMCLNSNGHESKERNFFLLRNIKKSMTL